MFCEQCGIQIDDGTRFCQKCFDNQIKDDIQKKSIALILSPLSIFSIAIAICLPILAMAFCHSLVNIEAPLFLDPISESQFLGEYWDSSEPKVILISGITAVVINLLFLFIIPLFSVVIDKKKKGKYYYAGLILNIILGIGFPMFYYFMYGLDNLTMWAELFPLHIVAFPVTFIIGLLFVNKIKKNILILKINVSKILFY